MIFRSLDKDDIAEIVAISQGFSDAWNSSMLEGGFSVNLSALGVFDDRLVAYVLYEIGLDFADLEMIFVSERYRKKGLAKELIALMEKDVDQKVASILLEVREGNSPAISLYNKCGFKKINTRKKYYSDGENCLVMIKEL